MTLYMLVTDDEYELPISVRDSPQEIADLIGIFRWEVYSRISRKSVSQDKYNGFRYKIIKIDVDDD